VEHLAYDGAPKVRGPPVEGRLEDFRAGNFPDRVVIGHRLVGRRSRLAGRPPFATRPSERIVIQHGVFNCARSAAGGRDATPLSCLVVILVDPARWPWRDRRWAHLVSDVSYHELHLFAGRLGLPRRVFQGDHYDVPAEVREEAIRLGAAPVDSRELVVRLRAAGLRLPPSARRPVGVASTPERPLSGR
jgi:Protein of unknown function (DUF4031)